MAAILLMGCTAIKTNIEWSTLAGKKNCLINAIGFQDAYSADKRFDKYRWSRVLCIGWRDGTAHAVCVFHYKDSLMVYDNTRGSWTLTRNLNLKDNSMALARLWAPNTGVILSYYMEDIVSEGEYIENK